MKTMHKYDPKSIRPSGLIRAHNHVQPYFTLDGGGSGFHQWFDWPPGTQKESRVFSKRRGFNGKLPNYVICKCGWRPELGVHYRVKGVLEAVRRLRLEATNAP